MQEKKLIEFRGIVKSFDNQIVLKGVNLDIYENEFVTLLGPSGCGKTTLLRILGGFLNADEGQVFGIGCKIFTIAGPVILYGIFASWVLGVLYWVWNLIGM